MHWTLVCETRVTETDDPVNYRWVGGQARAGGPQLHFLWRRTEERPAA
jgi:hypothetical protein